jgi:hypothetical protein
VYTAGRARQPHWHLEARLISDYPPNLNL